MFRSVPPSVWRANRNSACSPTLHFLMSFKVKLMVDKKNTPHPSNIAAHCHSFSQRCHLTWVCSQRFGSITIASWCCVMALRKAAPSPSSGTPTTSDFTLLWALWGRTLAAPTATISSSTSYRRCLTRTLMWCSCCRYYISTGKQ